MVEQLGEEANWYYEEIEMARGEDAEDVWAEVWDGYD